MVNCLLVNKQRDLKMTQPKKPVTCRFSQETITRLQEHAAATKQTPSAIINKAVAKYFERLSQNETSPKDAHENSFHITAEDLLRLIPVLESIGKPAPLNLFLQLVELQREE